MKRSGSSKESTSLPLRSLNHVSFLSRDVATSSRFYQAVCGFFPIKRPASLQCEGEWLFGMSIGIHLLQGDASGPPPQRKPLTPTANHLSFQSDSLAEVEERLRNHGIEYIKEKVVEGGIAITQVFFHDPDGNMLEICNCDCLPILPLSACGGQRGLPQGLACPADICSGVEVPQTPGPQERRPLRAPIGGSR